MQEPYQSLRGAAGQQYRREAAYGAMVVAIDPATRNNLAYWVGRLRPSPVVDDPTSDACLVEDLAWEKFELPDPKQRRKQKKSSSAASTSSDDEFIQQKLFEGPHGKYFDYATHIDIELQNPTQRVPGVRRLFAGNVRAHAISKGIESAIRARRRALGQPAPVIRFCHPRSKFFTFGLECPSKKPQRKRLSERFQDAFFRVHGNDSAYQRWSRHYYTHFVDTQTGKPKRDDAADVRMAGIARLTRIRAGFKDGRATL
jgi:hypothetical protein